MADHVTELTPRRARGGFLRQPHDHDTPMKASKTSKRALTVILVAAGAAGTACGAPDAPQQRTLSLYEHDTQQANLDLGSPGTGPGDVFVFAGDLFDHQGGAKLGRAGGHATTTSGDPTTPGELLFTVTLTLARGQIEAQGLYDSSALFGGQTLPIAITGGTGDYRDARGDGTVQVPPDVPNQADANFVLTLR
jgi:hypothetical protein